ncbi:FlgB family protein [Sulfitobacter guttiformis]|uniref:Flagellar basal-body rod protein FlgB n=1 Tax=Sulfitobacter guttiformis TaxID=74349 RepID=A0A420DSA1_9RHOB|nr:FlgB family protein [Sulfitobacter guttiformis]KIN74549.1 putative flagellar basal-body rod protein FlgB [Sulfitobacter guttiformis KCTC 32187]RKE97135.1 flagellar basal-body rod protein FlgB [Sulfitobacter guttiformis]
MFENLKVFKTAAAMAGHAAQSQALISQNVANADTPGYVGKQLAPFEALYAPVDAAGSQRATRQGHLHGSISGQQMSATDMRNGDNPNQNTVSLEAELLKAAEAKSNHDRSLAIYKSALDVLRAAVRTR